ncbi:MAG: transcriptional antiterminator [Rhizobiales bacterium]|nr:transcriptional antiterminator [Hoeflea sp.]MBG20695.1 transcriptional antiterminator [Hyphomicrobiales bacterium]|tara:strand:- start:4628 stop:5239 length:612 start_codon:yes stop_codon:yes gene_type:complete
MTRRNYRIPTLGGAKALILHRPHAVVDTLLRQLDAIGLDGTAVWPELDADAISADYIFFDSDFGYDEQFPWKPGEAPMPLIALIGSEAPGRIEWALSHRADSHLLKPIGNSGVYSALLIARRTFDASKALSASIADLRDRVSQRQTIVQATMLLAARGLDETAAYKQLRDLAMNWNISIEEAARQIVDWSKEGKEADDFRGSK